MADRERVVWRGHQVPILSYATVVVMAGFLVVAVGRLSDLGDLIAPVCLILGSLSLLFYIQAAFSVYEITADYARVRTGVIIKNLSEIRIQDIRSIQVRGVVPVIDVGTLMLGTSGTAGIEVVFSNVYNPQRLRELIKDLLGGSSASAAPLVKCPNCGRQIPRVSSRCSFCRHDFRAA